MTTWKHLAILISVSLSVLAMSTVAAAEPQDGEGEGLPGDKDNSEGDDPGGESNAPPVEVVGYESSDENEDYKPKSDVEGSTWTFDPSKVELTTGNSDTGTNFQGARILKGDEDVIVQGAALAGKYEDVDNPRYVYWQGSTLFFGVEAEESGNSVDAIVEFFWFESSIPRGSDFYVMQVKVKSSPNPWDKWLLATEPGFIDDYIFFWNDVQPSQHLDVAMEPGGAHGALRWDFCVPFETYKWEPVKTMQISESYGAGYSLTGNADAKGKVSKQFKEGGAVADLTANANIQAKGYINNDFKVQSQYTITLYKWQMLVSSGGQNISYKLVVLPNDKETEDESGYYEYFIVIQAERGTPVHIEDIEVGGMFRHNVPLWIDGYEGLSASIGDIWITPPRGVCLPGDVAPGGTCKSKGVCGLAEPECVDNEWACPVMSVFEPIETTCDGLDNDCNGIVDEDIVRECTTACGGGYETCLDGKFQGCDAVAPIAEICDDGVDNDCDGTLDNGCDDEEPVENPANNEGPQDDIDTHQPPADAIDNGQNGNTDSSNNQQDQYTPGEAPMTPVPNQASSGCAVTGSPTDGALPSMVLVLAMLMMSAVLRRRRDA
ncbi:MAG: MYXO-CTERM domain-containing protein [Myxococcota bacterium]|jgi:MYXO-CTERM domain-containing protein